MNSYNTYPPRLFFEGTHKNIIALEQAQIDTGGICNLTDVKSLFSISATRLMANIRRYGDGRNLREPEQIHHQNACFFAIKSVNPPSEGWENFKKNNGKPEELEHLRAYCFDNEYEYTQTCITHFHKKIQLKLHPEDTQISHEERDKFLKNGCYYESEPTA